MIDKEVFAQRMALLAGRIGRELEPPVLREYYLDLSARLTTEQFFAASALAFKQWDGAFRVWPSPDQLVELIIPVTSPSLSALEAFEECVRAHRWPVWTPRPTPDTAREKIMLMGAAVFRAYKAAGGWREFAEPIERDLPFLRKRFVEAYEDATTNAEASQAAALALAAANEQVSALVSGVAQTIGHNMQRKITPESSS